MRLNTMNRTAAPSVGNVSFVKCSSRPTSQSRSRQRPCSRCRASNTSDDVPPSDNNNGSSPGRFEMLIQQRASGESKRSTGSSNHRSSWNAVEAGGGRGGGADYLYEIGQSANYNTNVDVGQNVDMIDSLFTGNVLGHKTDIADGSLRAWEFRTYNNIVGDYYVAPKFLEKVAMHVTKNYLTDQGAIPKSTKVPLIMGIWGPKGSGKTFQVIEQDYVKPETELAFKKMGMEVVVMSAGELESEVAGQPGRLIRERYRKAAELSRVRGRMSALMINDLDAGIGRFGNTQCTVNNQIVVGTLMNICDNPNQVSIHENWREGDFIQRVPIFVTGNDFTTLYAPLIRDGRMEKFYWEPTTEDVVNIVHQMYKDDGLARQHIQTLVETFRGQTLDFFGAVRASTYDGQIRDWMLNVSGSSSFDSEEANFKEVHRRLIKREGLPEFEPVPLTLDMLLAEGRRLVAEQDAVNNAKLSEEYMRGVKASKGRQMPSILGLQG